MQINVGVPHGSVLDPLLFANYLNDMETCFRRCKYHRFANDAIVHLEDYDIGDRYN